LRQLQEVEVAARGGPGAGAARVPAMRIVDGGCAQALGGRGDQGSQEAGEGQKCRGSSPNQESLSQCQSGAQLRQDGGHCSG